MNTLRLIRWTAIAAILVLLVAVSSLLLLRSGEAGVPLTSMTGEPVTLPAKGKPFALFFGFTHCPDICPTTMQEMADVLQAAGDKARNFTVYFVSVDPERDTPQLLQAYLSAFDPRLVGLTGSRQQIEAAIRKFGIVVEKTGSGDSYTFNHTASVLLFDAKGQMVGTLAAGDTPESRLAKLNRLLGS